jgi:hypothetical protein
MRSSCRCARLRGTRPACGDGPGYPRRISIPTRQRPGNSLARPCLFGAATGHKAKKLRAVCDCMCGAAHAGANFGSSQKPAIDGAQRRIIHLSPRLRRGKIDGRPTRRQAQPMRAAYHAVLADTHALADLGRGEARVPIGGELRVALRRPR